MGSKAATLMEQARMLSEDESGSSGPHSSSQTPAVHCASRRDLPVELLDTVVPEIEAAWTDEARRRVDEVDSGRVTALSNEEAQRIIAADD